MDARWQRRLKVRRISTIAIIVSLIILIIFAGFTVYGNKVGNFVINVNNDGIKLSLSAKDDLSEQTGRLVFPGVSQVGDITYGELPEDIAQNGIGEKSVDRKYLAFSFYLINNTDRSVDYNMDLNVIDTVGDPFSVLRVMLISGEKNTFDEANKIFALPEETEEKQQYLDEGLNRFGFYKTMDIDLTDNKVFSVKETDLEAGGAQKYTVVMWIEGCDEDCSNERLGDRVKLQLDITGY